MAVATDELRYPLGLHEYGQRPFAVRDAALTTGMTEQEVDRLIRATGDRVRGLLRLRSSPLGLTTDGTAWAEGVAGVVAVAPEFELEIVPKFLDPESSAWREDFFALATLSQYGHVLPRDAVRASTSADHSLPALLARAVVQMYWQNHRRPLRTYERRALRDFSLQGDVDPMEMALPDPEGFSQRRLALARDNDLNSIISGAVMALLPRVRDNATQRDLQRVGHALGPQPRLPRQVHRRTLPSRHARWQALHDLSVQILTGYGGRYDAGSLSAPGFVMNTWRAWEDLVSLGARLGLPGHAVTTQTEFVLGDRDGEDLKVKPDVVAVGPAMHIADAKYIGRSGKATTLGNSEIYEALAFMQATGADRIALFYPGSPDALPQAGMTQELSVATVTGREIHAIAVGVQGLSRDGGLVRFSEGIGQAMLAV